MKPRIRIRRLVVHASLAGVLLVILAYGASNLYLMTAPGKARLGENISARLHLETSVQGASWSPWNGLTVYGIQTRQPEQLRKTIPSPFLLVRSIQVVPDWKRLLRRDFAVREISVIDPELTVPIELATLIPRQEIPPAIAANTEAKKSPATPPAAARPKRPQNAPAASAAPHPPVGPMPRTPPDLGPTAWLRIENARISIASGFTGNPPVRLNRLSGKIPLGGNPANSRLRIKALEVLGTPLMESFEIPVKWTAPMLSFQTANRAGTNIDWSAGISFALAGGIPFQIDATIPPQTDLSLTLPLAISATFGKIAMQSRLQGLLLAPGTWNGRGLAQVGDIIAKADSQTAAFRDGQALLVFQNGLLQCPDARLVGETLSFMGNAAALSDGRVAAKLRIVSAPDTLVAISRKTEPDHRAPSLTPLSTPQRSALDLEVFGSPGAFYYRSNPSAAAIPLQ